MFGTILLFVFTVLQAYVFWRAASLPFVHRHVSRRLLIGISLALWAMFSLGRIAGFERAGVMATVLELLSMDWLGTLFLLSVSLLVVDIATGFGLFLSRFRPKLFGIALVVGSVLSAVAMVQGARAPEVRSSDVYIADLPEKLDGTVLIVLSDLHLGNLLDEQWLAQRIKQVQAERPDVVVLLGDVFDGHGTPRKELLTLLHKLSAPLGIWGVLGNHESYGTINNDEASFKEAGIHLLRNSWVELSPGLVLAGVDNLSYMRDPGEARAFFTKALAGRPTGGDTLLLSHAPVAADFAADNGVNLMLAGHTHGGQIWPFSYLVRQRFPFLEGRFEVGSMTLLVSRGTGTWGPRMRLWRPAEILRVTLRAGKKTTTGVIAE